jgi:hypothetical protein
MDKWLVNVAKLIQVTPADLLLVDNSPSMDYIKKVMGYCKKYKLKATIKHLKLSQDVPDHIRIEASQETIREYVATEGYDVWFSWECDQIIPPNSLTKMLCVMTQENYTTIIHNSWGRDDTDILNANMGLTLFRKEILKKIFFLPKKNGAINLAHTTSYDIHDASVIKKRILKAGGNYIELYGVINPIYHLNNS